MDFIVNLMGKFIVLFDMEKRKAMSLIEKDYGLIRYILKILRKYVVSKTKDGYLIFENKPGEVYLHRIIMEYYAQFDDKLYSILNNTEEYQVNHKNKNKWDNRLENLEMVTKLGNQLHKRNKKYDSEIVVSTEELLKIKDTTDEKDRKYLEKVSNRNLKILNQEYLNEENDKKIYDNVYIRFNNKIIRTTKMTKNIIDINTFMDFNNIILECIKSTNLNKSTNLYQLILDYKYYKCKNIIKNNFRLINKYYSKNKHFKTLLNKYKLLDLDKKLDLNNNILVDLYNYMYKNPTQITFYKNQLFLSIPAQHFLVAHGKYKSLKVLYLLGLLKRQSVQFDLLSHTVSAFLVPEYTEDLFSSTVLPRTEELIDMNLSKITYTILARNFNFETADLVFRNSSLKTKALNDFNTIDDIITVLSSSNALKEKVEIYGFITTNDIRYQLQVLNEDRKNKGLPFRQILDSDTAFVTSMVRNITEIRDLLNELGLKYVKLNQDTIKKIKKYQRQNKIEDVTLTLNQSKIVLKKLIVRTNHD